MLKSNTHSNSELIIEEIFENSGLLAESKKSCIQSCQIRRPTKKSKKCRKLGSVICLECKELLNVEVAHVPKQLKTNYDTKFDELNEKFSSKWVVHDWGEFPNFPRNGSDLYRLADHIVTFGVKFTKLVDGFNGVGENDHKILVSNVWEEMIMLYSVWTASQDSVFYNITVSHITFKSLIWSKHVA